MNEIKIENCGQCPFQNMGYCGLYAHINGPYGLYVKNEWRKNETHIACPVADKSLTISHV